MAASIDWPEGRSRAAPSHADRQPREAEHHERAAAHQRYCSPVVPAVAAEGSGHRQPRPRPPHQPRRGQHRRDPAPSDGRATRLSSGSLGPGGGRREPCNEPSARRTSPLLPRTACSAAAFASSNPRPVTASRSIRCSSPPRCRRNRISSYSMSGVGRGRRCCVSLRECRIRASSASKCSAILCASPATTSILNGLEARASVMIGDLLHPPPRLSPGAFDHVMANPPFHRRGHAATLAGSRQKRQRRSKEMPISPTGCASRSQWSAQRARVTFVHRADRIDALLGQIAGRAGDVVVFPLWPGRESRRAASWFACASRSLLRRGSPPASYCTNPTADSRPVRRACCARVGGSISDPKV